MIDKLTEEQLKEVLLHLQRLNPYIQFLRSPEGQIIFPRPPDADTSHQVFLSIDIDNVEEVEDREFQDELNIVLNIDLKDGRALYDT